VAVQEELAGNNVPRLAIDATPKGSDPFPLPRVTCDIVFRPVELRNQLRQ